LKYPDVPARLWRAATLRGLVSNRARFISERRCEMQRSWWSILGLASLIGLNAVFVPPAAGQPPRPAPVKPQARKLQGQIIRKDAGPIVVRTADREDVIVHLRPQARFLHKDRVVQLADVRVGVPIAVEVMSEGDRLFADTVTLVEEAASPAEETLIEGEIVRVV